MAMVTTIEKILAKAALLEAQAASLRLAVTLLNGDLHEKKQTSAASVIEQAISLRHAQKHSRPAKHARVPKRVNARMASGAASWKQLQAQRAEKRDQVVAIVRAYGKPMPIATLAAMAREKGIRSLTGIRAYVSTGALKQHGKRGKTRYSVPTT